MRAVGAWAVVAGLVVAGLVVAACGGTEQDASSADASASSTTSVGGMGPSTTAMTEEAPPTGQAWTAVTVVDPSRPTGEILDGDGTVALAAADDRTIPVNLLYEGVDGGGEDADAAAVEPRPLAIVLHGLGGTEEAGNPLPQRLHAEGFVVAMPNQQEISAPVVSLDGTALLPDDTSAVVDALLDPGDGVADDLAPQIDESRVAVIGHSVGATGALAMAFHDCCRDDRIDAVVTFGAAGDLPFGDGEVDFTGTPLLLVHGTEDQLLPPTAAQEILAQGDVDARLLLIDGADHFQPLYGNEQPAAATAAQDAIVAFLGVHLDGGSPDALDAFDLRARDR